VTIPAMDRFKEKFSVLPIEVIAVIAVIAINIFLATFGYAAAGWWLFIR
jgi:hypothetical protein